MEFLPETEIDEHQAEAMARGLYTVAAVDGVHERELALISEFYGGSGGTHGFAALARLGPIDPATLAAQLGQDAHRQLFLKGALLVAYADGTVSAAERETVGSFASAFGVDAAALTQLEAEVKDYLIRPLARLSNSEAVSQIAKRLDL